MPRLRKVIEGEQGGISEAVGWKGGGGFSFYRLGETIFNLYGAINPKIKFPALAQYIWFMETGMSLSNGNGQEPVRSLSGVEGSALLGIHNDTAYYLLYNGILGDKSPEGGNALTRSLLAQLPPFEGKKIIFGESCRISPDKLKDYQEKTLNRLRDFLKKAESIGAKKAFAETALPAANGIVPPYHELPEMEDVPYVCLRLPTKQS